MLNFIKSRLKQAYWITRAAGARLRVMRNRPPRFSGAFATRDLALASLPDMQRSAYDNAEVAEVNFVAMTRRMAWDYPVVFWISKLIGTAPQAPLSVLDAGGHMGTKYISFSDLLPVEDLTWSIYDVPAILRAGRAHQAEGLVPAAIRFVNQPGQAGQVDLLLASGLLQYLDIPLADLVAQMAEPPRYILLNKVALRDGDTVVTLEQIGPAAVPYQIRSKAAFEAELAAMGYRITDHWTIPELGHRISTHPFLGVSESKAYMLEKIG